MTDSTIVLFATAASIGFIHTLVGPDHYIPFIVLSRARGWTLAKTMIITLLCGIGHILSSIALGLVGILVGAGVFRLRAIEAARGEVVAWLLMIFGFAYAVWGLRRAWRSCSHEHPHHHAGGESHSHSHSHLDAHAHAHLGRDGNLTPWVLFLIFVFGPCEPLIPLFMVPAAANRYAEAVSVAVVFGLATIATMLVTVALLFFGLAKIPFRHLAKHSHTLAGAAIFLCGAAIKFLGL